MTFVEELRNLRRLFAAGAKPDFLDDLYAELLVAEAGLDADDWEEAVRQLTDHDEESRSFDELVPLPDKASCLGYRAPTKGTLARYKSIAEKAGQVLRCRPAIASTGDTLIDDSSLWTVTTFRWLNMNEISRRFLPQRPFGEANLSEGPVKRLVLISRICLPDTVSRSSVLAIDTVLQKVMIPLTRDSLEWSICSLLSDGRSRKGEEIASQIQPEQDYNGHFKGTLASLVKRNVLSKRLHRQGYELTNEGRLIVASSG